MANTFDLGGLDENCSVSLIASIDDKNFAYTLLRTSAFDDYQKAEYDDMLSDDITMERLDEIVTTLKMNQSEPLNPKMSEIQYLLSKRLLRDGDD